MTKFLYAFLLFIFLLTVSSGSLRGQVVINEFSAANLNTYQDSFGKTEDWIELYNPSATEVDLGGWHLSDKESKPKKFRIPDGTMIAANGFRVFHCSGRDLVTGGEVHTNFKLTQTKTNEVVQLANPAGDVVERRPLGLTLVEHAHGRAPDGSANWKIFTQPSPGVSNNDSTYVDGYTLAPTIEKEAGFYFEVVVVGITNNDPGTELRYTLDGTNPTASSPLYTEPVRVTETTVIKAQSFSNNPAVLPGKMDFATFFINETFSLAVFSVAADEVIDLANGNGDLIPIGSLEYFDLDGELEATSFGSLNRHGQDSWILDHRSLDWISRDEMGYSKAVQAPLFSYSDRDEYQKFMFRNSGDDNYPAIEGEDHEGSTHVRDEYVQTLAREGGMELDTRAVERVILFLNGKYWGVYGMRERPVDHDYTDEYYDQGKYEVQYLSTWQTTEIEYGGMQALDDWKRLRDFILDNDMSVPENYAIADDSLDLLSLTDYMLVNLNTVASDWLNYNTGWWRGRNPEGKHKKWGYILWDLDAVFGYYINYTGVPNTGPDALVCDLDSIAAAVDVFFSTTQLDSFNVDDVTVCPTIQNGAVPYPATDTVMQRVMSTDPFCCFGEWDEDCQGIYDMIAAGSSDPGSPTDDDEQFPGNIGKHEQIFLKLLRESPVFKQLYYGRYADVMNTVFSCENMNTKLDSMLATIEPEMPRQIQRWGGTMTEWRDNVNQLKNFINERCGLLPGNLPMCYDELSGPYPVTLITEPDGVGEIDFNTLDIESFPWQGDYYGGMDNRIKAKVFDEFTDEYAFSHWESRSGNAVSPDVNSRRATIALTGADTLVAVFSLLSSTTDFDARYGVQVFPNPTGGRVNVSFQLPAAEEVSLELYSVLGRKLRDFPTVTGRRAGGDQQLSVDLGSDLPAGLYLLKMTIGREARTFRVTVTR